MCHVAVWFINDTRGCHVCSYVFYSTASFLGFNEGALYVSYVRGTAYTCAIAKPLLLFCRHVIQAYNAHGV